MNGYQIEARRRAREVVGDLRWQGMTVPPLYARLAGEFEDLVCSGGYAAWVAAKQQPADQRAVTGGWRLRPLAAAPERELPPDPSRPPGACGPHRSTSAPLARSGPGTLRARAPRTA